MVDPSIIRELFIALDGIQIFVCVELAALFGLKAVRSAYGRNINIGWALAFAFFDPNFFVSYLISIAVFGLFQAMYMANAGGAWDNAKKVIEVDMKEKGTELHAAAVVGDTVGDPFKDTSSVALNPIIKFTTLFGLLAMEIAIAEQFRSIAPYVGISFLLIALYFVYRSFYKMRIKD